MGQISNIQTLRTKGISISLDNYNFQIYLKCLNFLNNFKRSLQIKNVCLIESNVNVLNNIIFIDISFFYNTKKLYFYKKKKKINFLYHKKPISTFLHLLNNYFLNLKTNLVSLNLIVLNNLVNNKLLTLFYFSFKVFLKNLFTRRFSLYIDFIKITSLFIELKVSSDTFLYFLGNIFKHLSKGKHTQFLLFVSFLFNLIIKNSLSSNKIKGMKFVISGRIQAKMRSSCSKIIAGSVPLQTITSSVSYSRISVETLYGVFGFKLWTCIE